MVTFSKDGICEVKIPVNLRGSLSSVYPVGNASIIPYKNEIAYLCSFREFSYLMNSKSNRPYGFFKKFIPQSSTSSWFTILDENFYMIKGFDGVDVSYPDVDLKYEKWSHEDIRLFNWGKTTWFSGTTFSRPRRQNYCNAVGKVTDRDWKIILDVEYNSHAEGFRTDTHQKNWLAIPDRPGNLISRISDRNIEVMNVFSKFHYDVPQTYSGLTEMFGNAPLFKFDESDENYVALCHKAHKFGTFDYVHVFVVIDRNLNVVHMSREFRFDNSSKIEMSMSMFDCIRSNEGAVGITVCEDDAFQYVYLFDRKKLIDFVYG